MSKRLYDVKNVDQAIAEIHAKTCSIHRASIKYGVPRSTLQNRLHGRSKKSKAGPETILTPEEEQRIVNWILENYKKGFPRKKHDVLAVIKEFLDGAQKVTKFNNNQPGFTWYKLFLNRHPEIVQRTPEAITSATANVSETNIRLWFKHINTYLSENSYLDILSDPTRLFNADETGFNLCPKSGKVLALKGAKNVYETDKAKEQITVMFSFSASGGIVPPCIIYPYKRFPKEVLDSIPDNIKIGKTDNGWMNTEAFIEYIKNVFYPYLLETKTQFPIILFIDGHCSHLSLGLSKICEQLQIILICLYPSSARLIQPADLAIFRPLKRGWTREVKIWRSKNIDCILSKQQFAPILGMVVDHFITKLNIVNGFRTCGIYPFNSDAIDFSKFLSMRKNCPDKSEGIPTMDFEDLKLILGEEKIKELESETLNKSEDFYLLQQIYEYLKGASIVETPNNYADMCEDMQIGVGQKIISSATEEVDNFEELKTLTENDAINMNVEQVISNSNMNNNQSSSEFNQDKPLENFEERELKLEYVKKELETGNMENKMNFEQITFSSIVNQTNENDFNDGLIHNIKLGKKCLPIDNESKIFIKEELEDIPIINEPIIDIKNEDEDIFIKNEVFLEESEDILPKLDNNEQNEIPSENKIKSKDEENQKRFECQHCTKKFKLEISLKQHMITHTGEGNATCEVCSKKFLSKYLLDNHMQSHSDERNFFCEICSKKFKTKYILANHTLTHNEEKQFNCHICTKRFNQKSGLSNHLNIHHNDKRIYNCSICEKKFKRNLHLTYHMISVHSDEKEFECQYCPKTFKLKFQLTRHMTVHTDEERISCPLCPNTFRWKYQLEKHLHFHIDLKI